MTTIGDRIRERRLQLGLSQEELAVKMGYKSRSAINKIELGVNDVLQSKVPRFAKALETTPSYLMGWNDQPEAEAAAADQAQIATMRRLLTDIDLRDLENISKDEKKQMILRLLAAMDETSLTKVYPIVLAALDIK